MTNDLTNEDRIRIAERGAGVKEIGHVLEDLPVSGGPEDDAISAEVLKGEKDIQVSQDAIYVAEEDETA